MSSPLPSKTPDINWKVTTEAVQEYGKDKDYRLKLDRDVDGKPCLVAKKKSEMSFIDKLQAFFGCGDWNLKKVVSNLLQNSAFEGQAKNQDKLLIGLKKLTTAVDHFNSSRWFAKSKISSQISTTLNGQVKEIGERVDKIGQQITAQTGLPNTTSTTVHLNQPLSSQTVEDSQTSQSSQTAQIASSQASHASPAMKDLASKIFLQPDELQKLQEMGPVTLDKNGADWTLTIGPAKSPCKIKLINGDITTSAADFIVNAANRALLGGGGIDGAIHSAGGGEIREFCAKFPKKSEGVSKGYRSTAGEAKMTPPGKLPAAVLIHAVGPCCGQGYAECITQEEATPLLQKTYQTCLENAESYLKALSGTAVLSPEVWPKGVENEKDKSLKDKKTPISISFPTISTGLFAYPKEEAAQIAISTVVRHILNYKGDSPLREFQFVCYEKDTRVAEDRDYYNNYFEKLHSSCTKK